MGDDIMKWPRTHRASVGGGGGGVVGGLFFKALPLLEAQTAESFPELQFVR